MLTKTVEKLREAFMDLQKQLRLLSKTEWIAAGKNIPLADDEGHAYFYIIQRGFVREYYTEEDKGEITCGFYFENDFFGLLPFDNEPAKTAFQAMEAVKVCKMYWQEWKDSVAVNPKINDLWSKMIEDRFNNNINWMELFRKIPVDEYINKLMDHKQMAFKNDRLSKIIKLLQNNTKLD